MESYTSYGISPASLDKLQRFINQRKAIGKDVQPWEVEAFYKAEMDALANKANQRYAYGRNLALQEKALSQADTQFAQRQAQQAQQFQSTQDFNRRQDELRRASEQSSGFGRLLGALGSAYLSSKW